MNIDWHPSIKRYYGMGFYTNEQMKTFVVAEFITVEQYKEITGVEYVK